MLILTRGEGESIIIGDPATPTAVVTINSVRGDKVTVKIEAATSVPIVRSELAKNWRNSPVRRARVGAVRGGAA